MSFLDFLKGGEKAKKRPYKKIALVETQKGDYEKFRKKILKSSNIMLIIGKRGSGKTSLGMKLLEFFKYSERQVYIVGYGKTKLPRWIKKAETIEKAPNNSVVLIDHRPQH